MEQLLDCVIHANLSSQKIWEVLSDFGKIHCFHPRVQKSVLISEKSWGLGAKRRCHFYDGTSVVEEIVQIEAQKSLRLKISEFSLPLKYLETKIWVKNEGVNKSQIGMSMNFVLKGGFLGLFSSYLFIRPQMHKMMRDILKGLAYYSLTGVVVGKRMPSERELLLAYSH